MVGSSSVAGWLLHSQQAVAGTRSGHTHPEASPPLAVAVSVAALFLKRKNYGDVPLISFHTHTQKKKKQEPAIKCRGDGFTGETFENVLFSISVMKAVLGAQVGLAGWAVILAQVCHPLAC